MNKPSTRVVKVNGSGCRIWENGDGEPLVLLSGFGGYPNWVPFLEHLASKRRLIVPSLPGYPGADGHRLLDNQLDWVSATLDLLEAAEIDNTDLIGLGPGAALAAEVAAMVQTHVKRLVLIAPVGLFDEANPLGDIWALRDSEVPAMFSSQPEKFAEALSCPENEDEVEWRILQTRAREAAARMLWPIGDTGLAKRLHRITAPTLLLWGDADRVVPPDYANRFADLITGPCEIKIIDGSGHRVDFDAAEQTAETILSFLH